MKYNKFDFVRLKNDDDVIGIVDQVLAENKYKITFKLTELNLYNSPEHFTATKESFSPDTEYSQVVNGEDLLPVEIDFSLLRKR